MAEVRRRDTVPKLVRARYSPYSITMVVGGIGSSKSTLGAQWFMDRVLKYPGARALCAGLTYDGHCMSQMKPYLEEELPGVSVYFKPRSNEMVFRIPGKSEVLIDFVGMKDKGAYKRIMYKTYDWIWADELTSMHPSNWLWLIGRLRGAQYVKQLMATTVPDSPDSWVAQEIQRLGMVENENLYKVTTYDNPFIIDKENYWHMLETTYFGGAYRRLVMGEFASLDGDLFKREPILVDQPLRQNVRVAVGVDAAYSRKTYGDYFAIMVYAYEEKTGLIYQLDGFLQKGMDISIAGEKIISIAREWDADTIDIEDPMGGGNIFEYVSRQFPHTVRVQPKGDKVTRATRFISAWNEGKVKTCIQDAKVRTLINSQILQFPAGDHDDAVDASVYCYERLIKSGDKDTGIIYGQWDNRLRRNR